MFFQKIVGELETKYRGYKLALTSYEDKSTALKVKQIESQVLPTEFFSVFGLLNPVLVDPNIVSVALLLAVIRFEHKFKRFKVCTPLCSLCSSTSNSFKSYAAGGHV